MERIVRRPSVLVLFVAIVAALLLTPRGDARAFCGFYVAPNDAPLYADASMVAMMRDGTRTVLSMSNNYKGPPSEFAMVVPVPVVLQKEDVKTLPHDVFHHLEALSAPRLVEYWEQDPCYEPTHKGDEGMMGMPMTQGVASAKAADDDKDYGVKIEAKFAVGEYEIVVLSAEQSDGLESWLHDNHYNVPKGAAGALAPYIKEQQKFFVAKVDPSKVQHDDKGVVVLSPLRFAYESNDFRLPVRLGLLNANGKQDLIVFVLSRDSRYEVANYTNAFIPTNIDVADATRDAFGAFYASLFDAAVSKAGGKAVITEYAWQSSSCDPCPTPPLGDGDVALLGGDILYGMPAPSAAEGVQGDAVGGYYGGGTSVILTRLHTRYDAATLSDDLVFRAAPPMVGGREHVVDEKGALEKGAVSDPENNFQARYAIRHAWTGEIACAKPHRGVWGGPPDGAQPATVAATGLAAAPRDVQLASMIVSKTDELGIKSDALPAGMLPPPPPKPFPWARVALAVGTLIVIFGGATLILRRRPAA
jgi:hypothetical protein